MNIRMMKFFAKLLLAMSWFALAGNAAANIITGSIGFTGAYSVTGGNLATATAIDITGDVATVTGTVDGAFASAGISAGDTATYHDFTFNPFVPINNLWLIGGFSFDLKSLANDFQSSSILALSGTGTIRHAGYDDTSGDWVFTANKAGSNFTFSSSDSSTGVPEPSTVMLTGIGMVLLGLARRIKNA